jgi:hypothetical protein
MPLCKLEVILLIILKLTFSSCEMPLVWLYFLYSAAQMEISIMLYFMYTACWCIVCIFFWYLFLGERISLD